MKFAFRSLLKSPGFSVVAIVILALGIGASTAIFSVVHALLLSPLPYHRGAELVEVQFQHPQQGSSPLTPATFLDVEQQVPAFSPIAAQQYDYVNLTRATTPTRLTGAQVTANYLRLFGVSPLRGRAWTDTEAQANAAPVVVLSEGIWRSQFNARETLIGEQVMLDDVAHTVVGIMPASFSDPWGNAALWRPILARNSSLADRRSRGWGTFARLREGVTPEQATVELATLAHRLQQTYPENFRDTTLSLTDLKSLVVGDVSTGLLVVLGAVGCVLAITCANVAGLSVVRAIGRSKELAVRAALGASRRQLLNQLLSESLLLALIGGALGLLVASWGISAIIAIVGDGWLPRVGEIAVNTPVLIAGLALTLLTGIACGLIPAWTASRTDPNDALKQGAGRGSSGPTTRRLRSGLVVVEIALALMLLVGAGLLGRSFSALLAKNPGMRTDQVLTLGVSLSAKRYDTADKRRDFYLRVEQAVAAVPGVTSASFTNTMPFQWGITNTLIPVGPSNVTDDTAPAAYYDSVGTDYFKAGGIPLLAGRGFTTSDDARAPGIVLLSAATAKRLFGIGNPIGRRLRSSDPALTTQYEVVGIVGDVLRTGLTSNEPPLQIYRPLAQRPTAFATLLIRTALPSDVVAKPVQQAIWSIDPDQPIEGVRPLAALVRNSVTQPRLYLTLFGLFAGLALVLSAIGLYGLIAYGVAQRTREFGIRVALGANSREVLTLVLREGLGLIALGLALGTIGAFAAANLLRGMVYTASVYDPTVFLTVPLLLIAVALLASVIPALRATRVNPIVALRSE